MIRICSIAIVASAVGLLGLGCIEPHYGDAPFACVETGRCPGGYRCIDGLCQRDVNETGPIDPAREGGAADQGQDLVSPGDAGPDGAVPSPDSSDSAPGLAPFGTPKPLTKLNSSADDSDPSLTADLRQIFFTSTRAAGVGHKTGSDIWTAQRSGPTATWSSPTQVTELNSGQDDVTPEISADGLTIHFSSARQGEIASDVFVATRPTHNAIFTTPTRVASLSSGSEDRSPTLSSDGLRLVLASSREGGAGATDLFVSGRGSPTAPWSTLLPIVELNGPSAEPSAFANDSGTVIYLTSDRAGGAGGTDLWRATRSSPAGAYGPPAPVTELNSSAADGGCWLAADGATIVFHSRRDGDSDLFIATR